MRTDDMKVLAVIPARYASSRFPGKPLALINGKPMIRRVYEQCLKAGSIDEVVVATDDERIASAVTGFDGNVMMTSSTHKSGTERCNEVANRYLNEGKRFDIVINVQGDEPYIEPSQIDLIASCFGDDEVEIGTLIKKIENSEELFDPNVVKVVTGNDETAILFSRQTIPFLRGVEKNEWLMHYDFFKHIGIYAYRPDVLKIIAGLSTTPLEKAESLEQLRWLENGYKIKTRITTFESISVDTPADLEKLTGK
jgi:3-deoxy-manno-octulosonate cytidylyltransferase (CMP-KDO synthetase)